MSHSSIVTLLLLADITLYYSKLREKKDELHIYNYVSNNAIFRLIENLERYVLNVSCENTRQIGYQCQSIT